MKNLTDLEIQLLLSILYKEAKKFPKGSRRKETTNGLIEKLEKLEEIKGYCPLK